VVERRGGGRPPCGRRARRWWIRDLIDRSSQCGTNLDEF
jgi:hypothetical protein